jgi:dihydrofolate reductase
MIISLIVAMDRNRGIGLAGQIPWRLSDDLRQFRRLTMGHTLIQGRITWESIGRALPGRRMVVLTRQADYQVPDGIAVCRFLEEALKLASDAGDDEVFIGGGEGVYREALPLADRIYLTHVDAQIEVDTVFPIVDESQWHERTIRIQPANDRNQYAFVTKLYQRKKNQDLP